MEIVPQFGDQPITASNVTVRVNSADRDRALALAQLAQTLTQIQDDESFNEVRHIASQLKNMVDEIELGRKQAKQPFSSIGAAIDELARDVAQPVKTQQTRILGLLGGYVEQLEAAKREEERQAAEAKRLAQEEADRKVREARAAQDIERLAQLQLEQELAMETIVEPEPPRGLVPGGRVNHTYEFELVNVQQTCDARCFRLLRWQLDLLACRDSVKNQLELAPDLEPTLPGIKITRRTNVSVKAASRIK